MRIHKEGYLIILIAFITLGVLSPLAGSITMPLWMRLSIWVFLLLMFAWIVRFFRSPQRMVVPDDGLVLSPADGRIVAIEEVIETEYFGDHRIQVSVFMSPNNVHINWSPVSGQIKYTKYHPGRYLVAWHPKSSSQNERSSVVVERADGIALLVRQIAGAMARRVVTYAREGNNIRQGDEIGFIKFGSRVDVFLPRDSDIKVELNDKVRGNVTVLAVLKNAASIKQ
ncbi:MAG: phosphatidylserine decarboxylase family protein [Lentimicrobium sp.]|jgi:phosphatidylserine decarboxylase|nr:phosphatidylserine decarboxylase family protein [Lentimicrobium sp.]MDD2527984.1 phosphatidylserine decarboxylase family protein [Lentimicrobiaceae bacterium]MDD4597204.1 phosphatidylserine decarboxylase family protein [Lentimicrobiaceae bacterium]MDY0025659.1 phosphatidylserine decarboxylase family protein [Lentimicrobium sp.]HAH58133.1 phosphatidylserine decarboxylase family protein [Bacteroidales bacterium]